MNESMNSQSSPIMSPKIPLIPIQIPLTCHLSSIKSHSNPMKHSLKIPKNSIEILSNCHQNHPKIASKAAAPSPSSAPWSPAMCCPQSTPGRPPPRPCFSGRWGNPRENHGKTHGKTMGNRWKAGKIDGKIRERSRQSLGKPEVVDLCLRFAACRGETTPTPRKCWQWWSQLICASDC